MSLNIYQYPVLNRELCNKLGYSIDEISLYYNDGDGRFPLQFERDEFSNSTSTLIKVMDASGKWHPDDCNLEIVIDGVISNPSFLFGINGIASSEESELDLSLLWMDKDSNIRGGNLIRTIKPEDHGDQVFEARIDFEPGTLRGSLDLIICLLMRFPGKPSPGKYYANQQGTFLGAIDLFKILIQGNDSLFPISVVSESGKPLWWVKTNISDPNYEPFNEDHFAVYLNREHPGFTQLNLDQPEQPNILMNQILTSALFTLIMTVMKNEDVQESFHNGNGFDRTSITGVLRYMLTMYKWMDKIYSPEDLIVAIGSTFDNWR